MDGFIHSIESFSTVDGPGIRYVVFMQGCTLRCKFCHNPDSWDMCLGMNKSSDTVVSDILRYKHYLKDGGVTLSGGEPLLQIEFATEIFAKLKSHGIHTCIDTSGAIFDKSDVQLVAKLDKLMAVTDMLLLDLKHIDSAQHHALTGSTNENIVDFYHYLHSLKKRVWVRYVLIPTINDSDDTLQKSRDFVRKFDNIERVDILPFHKMGAEKYKKLSIVFPFENIDLPTDEQIKKAEKYLHI